MSHFQLFSFVFDSKKKKEIKKERRNHYCLCLIHRLLHRDPKRINPAFSLNEFSSMRLPVKRSALFHHTLIHAVDWQAPRHRILLQSSYG